MTDSQFDIFISYSEQDGDWVRNWLLPRLEQAGCRVCIDTRDFEIGKPRLVNKEDAVAHSAFTILVLSPFWVESEAPVFEALLLQDDDPMGLHRRLLPVMLADCQLPKRLAVLTRGDFREPNCREDELSRLLKQIGKTRVKPATLPEPEPVYRSRRIREITEALKKVKQQLEQAAIEEKPTQALKAKELELKRQLREGGRRQPGEILCDRYKLIDVLGKGGFATVWKAWDIPRLRLVAVKIMHGQFTGDKTRKERFFRGARKMRELRHPAVVDVFDEQCEDEGFPFFAMAYQAGGNLHEQVLQGKLDEAAVLAVIHTVGEALAYAHQHDLVHRDIKPGNILLDGQGRACLTDFDLVKAADSTGGTQTHAAMGTFGYAAPELMAEAKDAGVAADIYGLGMTTLFALYGKDLPYEVVRDATGLIEPLACAPHLKKAITKATAWSLEERFPTVEAFLAALEPPELLNMSQPDPKAPNDFKPGDDWVYIAPGEFIMGDDQSEYADEKPAHQVRITEAFWLGRYPVTNRAFRQFWEAGGYKEQRFWTDEGWDWLKSKGKNKPLGWDRAGFEEDEQPVVGVSWFEASAYCKWLSGTMALPSELSVMLPTGAQWEWAARGSENRPYPWGTRKPSKELANFGGTVGKTTAVGSCPKGATPEGVHDMAGNVWEWCRDHWSDRAYRQRQSITEDPYHQEGDAAVRALRGGAWYCFAADLRASNRYGDRVWNRDDSIGFRCCLCRRPEHG
ncbi:MAG: SUMF1/EgtB/PvdO family nonheme iron enzyme [Acidobacteriota bacterium]|nr:SUMF1/EgtB/PvdO family nonheme iron enzyme [Acidobacteriota bacterium]